MRRKNNQKQARRSNPSRRSGVGENRSGAAALGKVGVAVLMATTVGLSGCQTFRLPGNPFAGGKLPMAKLPLPKLPSLAKLPKPNFGNFARAVRAPSEQFTSANNPSIASAKRQPPPPPARKFDSSSTDEKIVDTMTTPDRQNGFEGSEDFNPNTGAQATLTDAQKRFRKALAGQLGAKDSTTNDSQPKGLWSDYQPDTPAEFNSNLPVTRIEELAKVNRNLYDQYGKLNTGQTKSSKLSEPFDPKMFAAKVSNEELEKTNRSVAKLKSELEKIRTRGVGSSDQFTVPARSALEIAGAAPLAPVQEEPKVPLFKGFGDNVELGAKTKTTVNVESVNTGTVNIPHPRAHLNVLRARPSQIPGLVQPIEIRGGRNYASTQFNQLKAEIDSGELPLTTDSDSEADWEQSKFVEKMNQRQIPTLTATATGETFEMPLPREVSEASIEAIEENQRIAAATPAPKIVFREHDQATIASANQSTEQSQKMVGQPAAVSQNDLGSSELQVPTAGFARVQSNPFYQPAVEPTAPATRPAVEPLVVAANPDLPSLSIMPEAEKRSTNLPESIVTGQSNYAPGSVVQPQGQPLWR
jgi:hypothetical protein